MLVTSPKKNLRLKRLKFIRLIIVQTTSSQTNPLLVKFQKCRPLIRKDMFPAYPWSYGIDFEGQTLFQGEIPEQWRRYSKGSEWLFDVVWINYF